MCIAQQHPLLDEDCRLLASDAMNGVIIQGDQADSEVGIACVAQEEHLLRNALAFYRLMAAWLLRMASPAVAAGHPVELPLPTPAPAEFRMLPVIHLCMGKIYDSHSREKKPVLMIVSIQCSRT